MSKTVEEQISGILRNAQENIKDAYDKGYKSGLKDGNINDETFAAKIKEAYNNGLNDAWECAKDIATDTGLNYKELEEIFGYTAMNTIFGNFSASEAITKIKEYEEKKAERNASPDNELHIGDEVYMIDKKHKSVVTSLLDNGRKVNLLCTSGNYIVAEISVLHKTGRRFAIDEVLRELKGE